MRKPSKNSLSVAEELLDHVTYGLTRPDIIREWAEVIDEHDRPLLEAASDLVDSADMNKGVPDPRYVQRLRALLENYNPQPEQLARRASSQSWPGSARLARER
jgi:hypothetical protein